MSCAQVKYFLLFLLFTTGTSITVSDDDFNLNNYIESLERIVGFAQLNLRPTDMNFVFGLFIANVNLKVAIENKKDYLPESVASSLSRLTVSFDDVIKDFKTKAAKGFLSMHKVGKKVLTFLSNEWSWMKHVKSYNNELTKLLESHKYGRSRTSASFDWEQYLDAVAKWDNLIPDPKQSDICFASLGENALHYGREKCSLPEHCYEALINGTDYGYSLAHRALLLLSAHGAAGCWVLSQYDDEVLMLEFCMAAHAEVNYIVKHDYVIPDLMMEQIAVCTLNGHSEFIRRVWMTKLLQLQQPEGCFIDPGLAPGSIWFSIKDRAPCNTHVTAVAAGSIAAAIRFLIANMY